MKTRKGVLRNQKGFTLIEIIAVLVILGILSAVAIPKYMGMQDEARKAAAKGQIAEVKGRLSQSLGRYMLANSGTQPANGAALVTAANGYSASSCPTTATVEGDFEFKCTGAAAAQTVTIDVSKVDGVAVTGATGDYVFTTPAAPAV